MDWPDRVKEFRRVKASELRRNPRNYRIHTPEQRSAFRGVLSEIGFAGAVLARETQDGGLELIDGELRADEADDREVPCLILDVHEEEAAFLLASFDELTKMAQVAADRYHALLSDLKPEDADMRHFVASRLASGSVDERMAALTSSDAGPPEMELTPHEHYDYVIVLARNTQEWNVLCELLELGMVRRGRGNFQRIGIGRAIEAATERLHQKWESFLSTKKRSFAKGQAANVQSMSVRVQRQNPLVSAGWR
jgi:hypothetical protein